MKTELIRRAGLTAIAAALALTGCKDNETAAASPAEPLGAPLMYSVSDSDSEVILFGTFHILPEGVEWRTPALEAAIARAGEVWYELPAGADSDPAMQQLAMQYGMSETPLSERLSDEQNAKLAEVMGELGIPVAAVEPMRPWLAAVSIPVFQMMQAGYSPDLGAEMQLQQTTGSLGQRAFETAEQQLKFFADFPEEKQIDYLMQVLDDAEEGVELIDDMAAAWAKGDVAFLETEIVGEMRDETPELYDVLLVERNRDWAAQLDAEMKGEGVDFVAVGAGHLIGPDSVPVMLEDLGYEVKLLTE